MTVRLPGSRFVKPPFHPPRPPFPWPPQPPQPSPAGRVPRSTGYLTTRAVRAQPALPALPPAGGTFIDPVFGTRLLRLTDERDGDSQVGYSYWPTCNKDGSLAVISTAALGFTIVQIDPVGLRVLHKIGVKPSPSGGIFVEDAIWSGSEPAKIFCHTQTGQLYAYVVGLGTFSLIKDFNAELPGEYQWQMSKSLDDDTFAFTRRGSTDYGWLGYVVWKRSTGKLVKVDMPDVNEVHLDKSGLFLYATSNNSGAGVVSNQVMTLGTTGSSVGLTDDGPDFAVQHYDTGNGDVVGHDRWNNQQSIRRLADPHRVQPVLDLGADWGSAQHTSRLADDPAWVLFSAFADDTPGLFHGEIFQVSTDGQQRLRRLAHHRSVYQDYYDSPRANISRDGCLVAFASNWGGAARHDVFVASLA